MGRYRRGWVGAIAAAALATSMSEACRAAVDFQTQVLPLLAKHCSKCHGESRSMARLRLDSAAAIGAFPKKQLLVAGQPDASELFLRVTLPAEDKKRMPKGGDPLPQEEIDLIKQWIAEGAALPQESPPPTSAPPAATSAAPQAAEAAPSADDADAAALAAIPAASSEAIEGLEQVGASVIPLFQGSSLLQVSFARAAVPPADEALVPLEAAAPQIVALDLSGCQASSAGYVRLASLTNLRRLHLERSTIDDAALAHLAGLHRLEYLNLYESKVTDAGLSALRPLGRLQKLYLWKTPVTYGAAMSLQSAIPGLIVDLGADHPEVVRARLTKLAEIARADAADAAGKVSQLQTQLAAAQQESDRLQAQVKQLESELSAVAPQPASGTAEATPPPTVDPSASP